MSIIKTYKTTYYIPKCSICPGLLEQKGLFVLRMGKFQEEYKPTR